MKNLTEKKFSDAPLDIQILFCKSAAKYPICLEEYENAIKNYPEYFPEEVEHERKWKLIPQEIHDKYLEEMEIFRNEIFSKLPENKGVFHWISNPKELELWQKKYNELKEKGKPKAKLLHEKFYNKYGIKWNSKILF